MTNNFMYSKYQCVPREAKSNMIEKNGNYDDGLWMMMILDSGDDSDDDASRIQLINHLSSVKAD